MQNKSIALMIYGEPGSPKNALTEEKYKKLATHFIDAGFVVDSVLYHDAVADKLEKKLLNYGAVLVWVNPIEQGSDRKRLDSLLMKLSNKGCFVSAHPDTILKIGTKEILYKIRETEFGGDTRLYDSFTDFRKRFPKDLAGIRILKQYRGNGGDGVFKVDFTNVKNDIVTVTHAKSGSGEEQMTVDNFFSSFETYFSNNNFLIDQEWNANIINGLVRCYLTGATVCGFGYQEVNALYPSKNPGQRFYFSEDCGLFQDLRQAMEKNWISQLQQITGVLNERLPVIWDADFFINKINNEDPKEKYSLCEINASSVSPFPESSIPYIVNEVRKRI